MPTVMDLTELLQQSQRPPGIVFKPALRIEDDAEELLRNLIGLANADMDGVRGIVFGAETGQAGHVYITGLEDQVLAGVEAIRHLAANAIEPRLGMDLLQGELGGRLLAGLVITHCDDPPYVAGEQAPARMRRGECWVREGNRLRAAQRSDFDRMYAGKAAAPAYPVLVGLDEDPAREVMEIEIPDTSMPPSLAAIRKLKAAITAKKTAAAMMGRDDTSLARLAHARIYGTEAPYSQRGLETLIRALSTAADDYREADLHYRFEERAVRLNLAVCNQAREALTGAAIEISLPAAPGLAVATRLYPPAGEDETLATELRGYPEVRSSGDCVRVRVSLGELPPGVTVNVFDTPLRLAVDSRLRGQKVAVRYTLVAHLLPAPVRGRLKLKFRR